LAAFGNAVAGVIVGMIVLDLGATAADISNRTIIFSLRPEIRTRLAAIYTFGKFAGAGAMAWLAGLVWSISGWPAVCALGALLAAAAAVVAWVGIGRTASQPNIGPSQMPLVHMQEFRANPTARRHSRSSEL
jgi:MFS family permease